MSYALLIKSTGKVVAEALGKEKAEKIMQQAQRRFEELKKENANDSKDLQRHTYKRIYPGIAMYEALRSAGAEQKIRSVIPFMIPLCALPIGKQCRKARKSVWRNSPTPSVWSFADAHLTESF